MKITVSLTRAEALKGIESLMVLSAHMQGSVEDLKNLFKGTEVDITRKGVDLSVSVDEAYTLKAFDDFSKGLDAGLGFAEQLQEEIENGDIDLSDPEGAQAQIIEEAQRFLEENGLA